MAASVSLRGGDALIGLRVTFTGTQRGSATEGEIMKYNNSLSAENVHPFGIQLDEVAGLEYVNLPDENIIFYEEIRAALHAQSDRDIESLNTRLLNLGLREKYSDYFTQKIVATANVPLQNAHVSYMLKGKWHEGKVATLDPYKKMKNATIIDQEWPNQKPHNVHLPCEDVIFYHELRVQMQFQSSTTQIAAVGGRF